MTETRRIGASTVPPVGLGGALWSLVDFFDASRQPDDEQAISTIHAALDAGVRYVDTARVYTTASHPSHNEALIARALASHPAGAEVVVGTKGGHYRSGSQVVVDTRPEAIRRDLEASLHHLGVDRIALYQLHWPSHSTAARLLSPAYLRAHDGPEPPIEEVMATFAALRDEGLIRDVGVCNVTAAEVEAARSVVPIASVQNHFSPFDRRDLDLVQLCAEQSIAYLAWSPLGGGVRGGAAALREAFPVAAELAARKGVSVQRLALAWLLRTSPTIIPICGARRAASIEDSARATHVSLTDEELATLDFGRGRQGFYSELQDR
jgi:aryl-alcohol dehydrogenase-like predicted oxidoreductase